MMRCAAVAAATLATASATATKPVLFGFDQVQYFSLPADHDGVMGSAEHAHTIESFDFTTTPPTSVGNYTFWFASEANKVKFVADPWKYAPRWEMHLGPPGGPQKSWAVYQGVLYHNFQPGIRKQFFQNATELISLAAKRWVGMWGKLEAGPFNVDCLAETWRERNCEQDPQPVPYHPGALM